MSDNLQPVSICVGGGVQEHDHPIGVREMQEMIEAGWYSKPCGPPMPELDELEAKLKDMSAFEPRGGVWNSVPSCSEWEAIKLLASAVRRLAEK